MDSHPEGVVLVSFGSALSPSKMVPERKAAFINAFKRLPMPIIWKWDDDDLSDMPKNVIVKKWLPQNDLLAHPNLKVLVSHGGLLSLQEALFHRVTIVGVPLGSDQDLNMIRAQNNGFAVMLNFHTLKEDQIVEAIEKAFTDESMQESIQRMHNLFVDKGLTGHSPMERALKAVDFAIKGDSVYHAKPAKEMLQMPFYAIHGYDVLLTCGLVALTLVASCAKAINLCFGCFLSK